MPELLTLGEARESLELKSVSGNCSSSAQFLSYLNQATRKLMNRGSFWGTVQRIQVCTYDCKVVWPRFVGTVLALNLSGHHSTVKNNWYRFLPFSNHDISMQGAFPYVNGCFGSPAISDAGMTPVFNQIACGHPVYLRVYPGVREDAGKKITVYGIDSNGLEVRTKVSGIWQEGETITLAIPYTQTTTLFRNVTRISKPVTQGVVRYYQWQPIGDFTYDMVWHDPGETNPVYRASKLPPGRNCCLKSIEALVKLEFIPVVADSDIVQISNLDALALMIQCIRNSNSESQTMTDAKELASVRELNLELRTRFPNESITTNVNYFGRNPMPIQFQ